MKWKFPQVPVFTCILGLVFLPGCSIREDRDSCPCQLVLDFGGLPAETLLLTEAGGDVRRDTLPAGTGSWRVAVPRGDVRLLAVSPPAAFRSGEGLRIPEGEACPELWLAVRQYPGAGEEVLDSVRLHKEHARLQIRIRSAGGPVPYALTVVGNIAGYDAGGKPAPGSFRYRMRPDATGSCVACVPRQADSSLMLEVLEGNSPVRSFALGEYLAESGYDWTAPDLADVSVEIDYARTLLTLRSADWSQTFSFEIVI